MNIFQEKLTELMDERNLNRAQLSVSARISSSVLDGYFLNDYFPSIDNAILLSEFFNC